jgi:two-component system, NtrC family, sensor kinase
MTRLRLPWWNRLSFKLTAVIALVTLLATAGFVVVALRAQHEYLTREALNGVARFGDTIRASTYHSMLSNQRAAAYQTMDALGQLEGIEGVRLLNKEGRITFSTDRSEIGQFVDKRAEACYGCHAAGQPLVRLALPSRARFFERGGHRVLAMVTPIYNEPGCSACHRPPDAQRVLGVVDVSVSLARIDEEMSILRRRTLLVWLLAVLVLAASVGLFTRRFVVTPIAALAEGAQKIGQLDLDQRVRVRSVDEIGLLSTAFNEMAGSLKRAREDLRSLNESLERQVEIRTAALKDAQAQLIQSEKLSSLGRLAASVAHEINNPLSGILTCAKLLIRIQEEDEPGAKARETSIRNLRLVQREAERCGAIVRHLLDFARQRPLSLDSVDVNQTADEALSLLGHQIAMQGIGLEKRLGAVPRIRADFGQLRQAIVNVALNACQAMPDGGTLVVTTDVLAGGAWVRMTISDTGPGIPPDHLPRIVDPFFTTKEKGTGLGLSVVHGIIERHGGKLEIGSTAGRGTTVIFELPASAPAVDPPAGEPAP